MDMTSKQEMIKAKVKLFCLLAIVKEQNSPKEFT
jgi:hypothetical protein